MSEIVKKSDIPRTDTTEKLRQRYNLDNITKLAEKLVYPVPIECGGTNADNIEGARDNLGLSDSSVGLKAYPVGAVYISFERTSPAALFGGTWTQLTNRFLYAANGSGATGGESTNTLVDANLPDHYYANALLAWPIASGSGDGYWGFNGSNVIRGLSRAFTNMPPYITCYMWRRTA